MDDGPAGNHCVCVRVLDRAGRLEDLNKKGKTMITNQKTCGLSSAVLSGVAHEGLTVTTKDGRRARLAIIDEDGTVLESGPSVESEVFNVSMNVLRNFWLGKGHIRVLAGPPNMLMETER